MGNGEDRLFKDECILRKDEYMVKGEDRLDKKTIDWVIKDDDRPCKG